MSSFIDKLKTQLGGYFAKEGDLATVATTGDYNDLINAPQGGGGGSSDKKIYIQANMETITQPFSSEFEDLVANGKVGALQIFGLQPMDGSSQMINTAFKTDIESNRYLICFDNPYNMTGSFYLRVFIEIEGQFTIYDITTINIQESQQTYII